MRIIIFVALGGGIGSVLRYLVALPINQRAATWGTITVNVIGSAILGFLIAWFVERPIDTALQVGLLTGVLGGFTTFSTFTAETVVLLDSGRWQPAFVNVIVSVVAGLAAAAAGFALGRSI